MSINNTCRLYAETPLADIYPKIATFLAHEIQVPPGAREGIIKSIASVALKTLQGTFYFCDTGSRLVGKHTFSVLDSHLHDTRIEVLAGIVAVVARAIAFIVIGIGLVAGARFFIRYSATQAYQAGPQLLGLAIAGSYVAIKPQIVARAIIYIAIGFGLITGTRFFIRYSANRTYQAGPQLLGSLVAAGSCVAIKPQIVTRAIASIVIGTGLVAGAGFLIRYGAPRAYQAGPQLLGSLITGCCRIMLSSLNLK